MSESRRPSYFCIPLYDARVKCKEYPVVHVPLAAVAADEAFPWLTVIFRWVHIMSACLAVAAPFFLRYIVMPVAKKYIGDEPAEELRQRIMGRWKMFVHLLIVAFIVTGFYAFWIYMPRGWPSFQAALFHMTFGLKFVLALVVFFIAEALVGKSPALEKIRKKHKFWGFLMILMLFTIVLCGSILRQLHAINDVPVAAQTPPASTQP